MELIEARCRVLGCMMYPYLLEKSFSRVTGYRLFCDKINLAVNAKAESRIISGTSAGLSLVARIAQRIEALEADDLTTLRLKLTGLECKFSDMCFKQIFNLIPEKLRPAERKTFHAYDGINNSARYVLSTRYPLCQQLLNTLRGILPEQPNKSP
jgi:hypothetical protein